VIWGFLEGIHLQFSLKGEEGRLTGGKKNLHVSGSNVQKLGNGPKEHGSREHDGQQSLISGFI
jgi:hypothetical protein